MKILHITSFDGNGGASKAVQRLNKALKDIGVESSIAVNVKRDTDGVSMMLNKNWIFRKYIFLLRVVEYLSIKIFVKPLQIPYSLPFLGIKIAQNSLLIEADIIHLHWINQGFLTPGSIKQLEKLHKPIVWTMHDSNAFTGGCHVRFDCERFEKECGNCPVLRRANKRDLSHYFWKKKQRAYYHIPVTIIAPSNWMYKSVKRSSLLGKKDIWHIPNTLDTEMFKPLDVEQRKEVREVEGWGDNTFVILSGFMPSKVALHKGEIYFQKSISIFLEKLNKRKNVKIIFLGLEPKTNPFPFPVNFLGKIKEETVLAKYYSAADVFLTTSIEDNFPNTVLESLSCGTPVVAFATGGIPDMVISKRNGFIAGYKDCDEIAEGLTYVNDCTVINKLRENARESVLQNYSQKMIAERHVKLYESLARATMNF